jgi:CRP-like cAMP-binding protein
VADDTPRRGGRTGGDRQNDLMFRRHRDDNRLDALGLSRDESCAVDAACTIVDVPPGSLLCRQDRLGRQLVWILDGVAGVERDGHVLSLVERGDVVGEGTIVGAHARCTADVVALTPLTVAVLSRQEWLAAADRAPSLVDRLFHVVLEREPHLAA